MKDKCLILLIETYSFCIVNNQDKIKRSNLLRLCNNKLKELSEGDRPKFGGSFEACLKKYSENSISPDKRLLTVVRSNVRHDTRIYPNTGLIEKHLRARNLLNIYTDSNIVRKTIRASPHESLALSAAVSVRVRRADTKKFLEEITNDLRRFLQSNLAEIRSELHLSEPLVTQLETLLQRIAFDNDKTKEYFTMMLEYLGIPSTLVSLRESGKQKIFYQKLYLYFEQWLKDYHRNTINEEEMTLLTKGDLESLSKDTREKLSSFLSSIEDYCNSSVDPDEALLQIVAELNSAYVK